MVLGTTSGAHSPTIPGRTPHQQQENFGAGWFAYGLDDGKPPCHAPTPEERRSRSTGSSAASVISTKSASGDLIEDPAAWARYFATCSKRPSES